MTLTQSLRFTLRTLVKNRGLTTAAVLTLALAIGANAAVFSLVYGVLLRPLPYERPERLASVWQRQLDGSSNTVPVAPGNFDDWRRRSSSFDDMCAWAVGEWTVEIDGEPEVLNGLISIGSPFDLIRVPPFLGRTYTAEEADRGDRVMVLTYETWQRLLGGDPEAVGKSVAIDETTLEVVGVMPPGFRFAGGRLDFFTPVPWEEIDPAGLVEGARDLRSSREHRLFIAGGRLRDGVTFRGAQREMEEIAGQLRAEHPRANAGLGAAVVPLGQVVAGPARPRLALLMGAALLMFLIGCVNLVNLLLAQAAARRREMAVRHSLGATRGRLVRQLLAESLLLSAAGGLAGMGLGAFLLRILLSFFSWQLPRAEEIAFDGPVLAFTLGLSLLAGLLCGTLPALRSARDAAAGALSYGGGDPRPRRRVFQGLMAAELALALMLVHGEGLLLRSFAALADVDPGFRHQGLLTLEIDAEDLTSPSQSLAFFEEVRRRLAAVPGVDAVAMANFLPLTGFQPRSQLHLVERPWPEGTPAEQVFYRVVSPEYFEVMEIPLVRGRLLLDSDRRDASPSVVVDAAFAERYFPGGDPLGQRLVLGPPDQPRTPPSTIVGVVGDVRASALASAPAPTVYVPQAVIPSFTAAAVIVRPAIADPTALVSSLRAEIRALSSAVPISQVRTMDEIVAAQVAPARSVASLLGLLTGVALVLAVLGVFGVISYSLGRRLPELGVRMALGADPGRIRGLVLAEGVRIAAAGLLCGLLGALAFSRLLESQLYEVSPRDPATLAAVSFLLLAIAALAVLLPAHRAARVDPVRILRNE